jgi:hypothetical protein
MGVASVSRRRAGVFGALLALAAALAGCGSSHPGTSATITDTAAVAPLARSCPDAVMAAIEAVAHRVYQESASGRIIAQAVQRVRTSATLAQAVEAGDATAARQALESLLFNQIVSVRVTRGARTLAAIERGAGIAPASGRLVNARGQTVGTFTVTVQGANGYAQTVAGLLAARVVMRSGRRLLAATLRPAPALAPGQREIQHAGVGYRLDEFAGVAFPDRPLSIALLAPTSTIAALCQRPGAGATGAAAAQAAALGEVAERVYDAEHEGPKAELLLHYVESSRPFRAAVLAGDAAATRAAIIGFFRSHLHIVRVRVVRGGRLLVDVGGPHVLAPIRGVIRDVHGHVAAHLELAIQDDLGFQILARAFTDAQVLMREGTRQVMGTLSPGPAGVPPRGRVVYRGVPYQAYTFQAEAFPSGALRISLLYPAG